MSVVRFPGHRWYRCAEDCRGCWCCEGGLGLCTVCGGGEASLPTNCPGERMGEERESEVQAGRADYLRREGWVRQPSRAERHLRQPLVCL